jgi:hypothetical protein
MAAEICARIADGRSLRAVCRDDDMPCMATVFNWIARHDGFLEQYDAARGTRADVLFDEIIDIADTQEVGEKRTHKANGDIERVEADMIEHRRLRVDARKWAVARMAPKKYGDRMNVDHGVQDSLADLMREVDGKTRGLPNGS